MSVGRITTQMIVARTLSNLRSQTNKLTNLQTQLATSQRVNAPSDDPIDARRAINARAAIAKNDQYTQNISSVGPRLEETVTSLQTITENLLRTRELTLQGANGTNDQDSLNIIAQEINQILEGVVTTSNHQTGSTYIFGGTRSTQPPYVTTRNANGDITAVTYQGNNEDINVTIGDGVQVKTNEDGSTVFQGTEDIFQTLIDIRDNLRAGDQSSLQNVRLTELEGLREQISQGVSRVGAVQNRLAASESELEDFKISLQQVLSDSVDADFADVVLNLNAQTNAYQAALSAGAQVIQPSLLDFIN